MAGFKTHVTVSSLLGCGYAAAGYVHHFPPATALLGGALCGFSGMLPDLDSDYGTPLRETMAFTAATVPMLLLHRFQSLGLQPDEMALLGISVYLFMRFGVTNMIRRYTVHRGMFHSIPAGLTFAGIAFLICGDSGDLDVRYFKAGGVFAGFMSHLILDEIYSFEWKGGAWRVKKSFGTAVKFWGDDAWANFSCYAKLIVVAGMILGEPSVMKQLEAHNPTLARDYQQLQGQYRDLRQDLTNSPLVQSATADASTTWNPFNALRPTQSPTAANEPPAGNQPPPAAKPLNPFDQPPSQFPAPVGGAGYDTAQRPLWPGQQ
jgi:LexA-binding, inner membrane-associated putative hydrolase